MILNTILLGIIATAVMDLAAFAQHRLLGIPSLNYAMVGRWLGHFPRGRLIHRPIGQSPRIPGEAVLGWAAQYLIGILFAAAFCNIAGEGWARSLGPIRPLVFGLATVAAPFLLLQPGMGAGIAARRTPSPWLLVREVYKPTSRSGSAYGSEPRY